MRDRSPLITSFYQTRKGRHARLLIWIQAKDRTTGLPKPMGLWNGDDTQDFVIGGQTRTYHGAGPVIEIDPITYQVGLRVRTQRIVFSALSPAVQTVLLQDDPRMAEVQMHVADFYPETHNLIDEPERIFKGNVDGSPLTYPPEQGNAVCVLKLLSAAANLRRPLTLKKSSAALLERAPGDNFRRYTGVGPVTTSWGEQRAKAPEPTEPAEPDDRTDIEREGGR